MLARIGHLHCRTAGRGLDPARVARVARVEMRQVLERGLERLLRDDPSVVVIRHLRTSLQLGHGLEDEEFAARWGRHLGNAVARTLSEVPSDGRRLMRFANQAEFVACFVRDLLRGDAWSRWFYGAFAGLRGMATGQILLRVLGEHRDELGSILPRLRRDGVEAELLQELGPDGRRALWLQLVGVPDVPSESSLRPFFAAAHRLTIALGLSVDPAADFERWIATGPTSPDWSRAADRAVAVWSALRFIARDLVDLDGRDPELDRSWQRAVESRELEWLELPPLREAFAALGATARDGEAGSASVSVRWTPSLRQVLEDLVRALEATPPAPPGSDRPRRALGVLTSLASLASGAATGPQAPALLERLLVELDRLCAELGAMETTRLLRRSEELRTRSTESTETLIAAVQLLPELGPALIPFVDTTSEPSARDGFTTPHAGLFLLWRAVLDARLPAWLGRCGDFGDRTPVPEILIALGLRWSGVERIDAGIAAFGGLHSPIELTSLRRRLAELDAGCLRDCLAEVARAHRVAEGWESAPVDGVSFGEEALDRAIGQAASLFLRVWARWLPGVGDSSAAYLLAQFVRRPGTVIETGDTWIVRLEPGPVDVVLEMARYFDVLEHVPWIRQRRVSFER